MDFEYIKEDFATEEPYKLVASEKDPFKQGLLREALAEYAKSVGFRGFIKRYADYQKSLKIKENKIYAANATDFSDQSLELESGVWEADDTGIRRYNGYGIEEEACCHPIMPIERLVNIDSGIEKLKIAYSKGKLWREIIVDKKTLANKNAIISLADYGIAVTSESASYLVSYLHDMENTNYDLIPERKSIGRLGYIRGEGFSPFVDGLIFDGDAAFRTTFNAVSSAGSKSKWLNAVKECRNMSVTAKIVIAASFGSVLVEPLGALPFFVHMWGIGSGTGKTVALMAAASVWGNPANGAYVKTFASTEVGLERLAEFLNHLPLCIDEAQLAKDSRGRLQFDVYKLAQGVGKTRGNKNGGIDRTPTWKNCILTTGESPLTAMSAGAGAVNRVIEIECAEGQKVITDGMRISYELKNNYGFAGREFVKRLYEADTIDRIQERYREIFKKLTENDTTEKQAMAAAVIIVADELACEWIYKREKPITIEEMSAFLASEAAVSAGDRGYKFLVDWVAQNGSKLCEKSDMGEVYGVLEPFDKPTMAYIVRSVFNRVVEEAGFSPAALLSYLKQKNLIETRGRNYTKGKRINKVLTECIALKLEADNSVFEEIKAENGVPWR